MVVSKGALRWLLTRPCPFSRLPSPQKSSRLVAAVAGNSRHVAGKSRACGGPLRCHRIILASGAHFCASKTASWAAT